MVHEIRIASLGLALALGLTLEASSAQETLAIRGGRILTMAGSPLEDGVIVIRDGKIAAIGKDVSIPQEAKVLDASGKTIMPGIVEAHSSAAMSQANETNPNVPYVSVMDGIDPMRSYFDEARRNGVTTVAVVPGNSTMIGGQAAIIKTGGTFVESMVLKRQGGVKISLQPQRGGGGGGRGFFPFGGGNQNTTRQGGASRMGHVAALRFELDKIKKQLEEDKNGQDSNETSATDIELQKAMRQLLRGEIPAFIYCPDAMDAIQAISLIKDYSLDPILVLGSGCHKAAKQIAASGHPVILDSNLVSWEEDPRSGEETKIVLSDIFHRHGVPFAFQVSTSRTTLGRNFMWYQAATAVKYGMPIDEALQAITLGPATILGVERFVGSLEVGKDADLVLLNGDPLRVDTWVEKTLVGGKVVYSREEDPKLKQILEGRSS